MVRQATVREGKNLWTQKFVSERQEQSVYVVPRCHSPYLLITKGKLLSRATRRHLPNRVIGVPPPGRRHSHATCPWRDSEKVTHHWSYCQRSQPPLNHTASSGHTRPSPTAGNAQKYLLQRSSRAPRQWKAELSPMKEAEEAWQLDAPSWAGSAARQGAAAGGPTGRARARRAGGSGSRFHGYTRHGHQEELGEACGHSLNVLLICNSKVISKTQFTE